MHQLIKDSLAYLNERIDSEKAVYLSKEDFVFFAAPSSTPTEQASLYMPPAVAKVATPAYINNHAHESAQPKPLAAEERIIIQKNENSIPVAPLQQTDTIRETLSKFAPRFKLKESILSSTDQQMQNPQVLIFGFSTVPAHLAFLKNVASAIHDKLVPTLFVEPQHSWMHLLKLPLKLCLAPPLTDWNSSELKNFYTPASDSGLPKLQKTPLLILEPLELYLTQPSLKKALWNTLVSQLSSSMQA